MQISDGTLDRLFQSMAEYNPTTNDIMTKIAVVLQPLGLAILGILFMVELTNHSKKFDTGDGAITQEVLVELALKYLIATFLVMSTGLIVDGIVWFGNQLAQWINSLIDVAGNSEAIPSIGKAPWYQKPLIALLEMFAYFAMWLSGITGNILIFLRAIQLYIVKAIAPILVAFFVSDELRSIAVNFFKHVMALVLQGGLLILIIGLIPIITANDYATFQEVSVTGVFKNAYIYFILILKYVTVIIVLIGSQNMAKKFMGAM